MAGALSFDNIDSFLEGIYKHVESKNKQIVDIRKNAVRMFVLELMKNIPVWSGRTVGSITVSNSGAMAPRRGSPPPSQWSSFGQTRFMQLGEEPMRPAAEARARASMEGADYSFIKPVFITINSEAWGKVETASAPDTGSARNKAVVSRIALERMKAAFPYFE